MHVDKWWIIQNYYVLKTDYIFKSNLPKCHLFKISSPFIEISFKKDKNSMSTMEFNPDFSSNDFESSDNEDIQEN